MERYIKYERVENHSILRAFPFSTNQLSLWSCLVTFKAFYISCKVHETTSALINIQNKGYISRGNDILYTLNQNTHISFEDTTIAV